MIIDAHVHVLDVGHWPDEWFDWVAYSWSKKHPGQDPSVIRPRIEQGLVDPDGSRLIADMDAAGIDKSVLLSSDWGIDKKERVPIETILDHAASIAKRYPDRVIPFGCIDPRRPNAAGLLQESISKRGMKGLKLLPANGYYPYVKIVFPLYEICEQADIPVLFHTGESLAITPTRFCDPLYVGEVQAAFPRLTIWLGHSGAKLWFDEALSVAAHGINTHLELSAWIWEETTEDEAEDFLRKLVKARDQIGAEKLIFATDHVSGSRVRGRAALLKQTTWFRSLPSLAAKIGSRFSDDEMELIMGGNAARCLHLDAVDSKPKPATMATEQA